MPVHLSIDFMKSSNSGTDIRYQAKPTGELDENEIRLANSVVAVCNLLSNEEFFKALEPWIESELIKLHGEQGGYNYSGKEQIM